jgi:pilus assembly protein CpaB
MRLGSITTLIVSVAIAIAAAYFGNAWLEDQLEGQTTSEVNLAPVVRAAADLGVGSEITEADLEVVQVPKQSVPEGSFSDPEEIIGSTIKQRVYKGDTLLEQRLLNEPGSLLAAKLEPGKRAITINVNETSGVSGFLLPGSWVDVIATSDGQARTLLQRLKIIAVGQQLDSGSGQAVQTRAVTLEVTSKQAEILASAGPLRLVLRNQDDEQITIQPPETEAPPALTDTPSSPPSTEETNPPSPPLMPQEQKKTVQVILGTEDSCHAGAQKHKCISTLETK